MRIRLGEHYFIAGRTGSGKTFLVHALAKKASEQHNIIVHDTKGTSAFNPYPVYTRVKDIMRDRKATGEGIFVYRPEFEELEMEYYELFYEWIYFRKNCIVVIDEAMQVCENPKSYPKYLKGVLTRGREYNISAWVCTQRPKTLPLFLLSEATRFYIFELNLAEDRKRVVEITGREEFEKRELCKYCFHYFDVKENKYFVGRIKLD